MNSAKENIWHEMKLRRTDSNSKNPTGREMRSNALNFVQTEHIVTLPALESTAL